MILATFGNMITGQQVRTARAWLDISQEVLAAKSQVARTTIAHFEIGRSIPQPRTIRDLQRTLEAEGVEFLFENEEAIGVRRRRDPLEPPDNLRTT